MSSDQFPPFKQQFAAFAAALVLAVFTVPAVCHAQQPDSPLLAPSPGLLVNQTITVAGQEFFRSFATGWRDMQATDRYVVTVHERPSARLGSQVWIEFAQRKVFQAVLPPGRSRIQAISEQAVATAYQVIVDADVQRMLFRDFDLAPDEI